jgi:hypothetical protein
MARPRRQVKKRTQKRTQKRAPKRILNCIPSRDTERDFRMEHARAAGVVGDATVRVPASRDLRADWWKVADQGSTGSCVGWAAADGVIRWYLVKAGKLRDDELLAPRFLWMAAKETDPFTTQPTTFIETAGTSIKTALDVARKYGVVRDGVLPFRTGRLYTGDTRAFYAIASQLKIASYFNLSARPFAELKEWIATQGPIVTRLDVDRTWDRASDTNGQLDTYQAGTARGGHAVAIVGYKRESLIVRNSWGTGWGDRGFAYASEDYARKAFTEAYGVYV